jgi:hypothetical protein
MRPGQLSCSSQQREWAPELDDIRCGGHLGDSHVVDHFRSSRTWQRPETRGLTGGGGEKAGTRERNILPQTFFSVHIVPTEIVTMNTLNIFRGKTIFVEKRRMLVCND